ncbi:MAG: hypothetical protein IT196_20165, partial [Acidimicrobiales bacterium]|nr:hypothetical protein [Acidimicrobiales bacterium]
AVAGDAPPVRPLRAVPDPAPSSPAGPGGPAPSAAGSAPAAGPGAAAAGGAPTVAQLSEAWAAGVLDHLPAGARAMYSAGQFIGVEDGVALFALPSKVHRDRCEAKAADVERSLAAHFGRPVPLRLVVDEGGARTGHSGGPPPIERGEPDDEEDDIGDVHALDDAPSTATTGLALLQQAFPGAEIVE